MRLEASIETGIVGGTITEGISRFFGIPYAAPPLGDNRWRSPRPAACWTGVRDATGTAPICPQPLLIEAGGSAEHQAEDCLYLNIWTPAETSGRRLPVMVWIHGGSLVVGSGSMPLYDGERLAREGVVVVSFNYRLGRFGFFAHPTLAGEEGAQGNFGFMDQLAVLQWVQRNIAAFGGDPANVTVFGESAGAVSVLTMMTLPEAVAPFHRAIIQSGGGNSHFPRLSDGEANGRRWALSLDLADPSPGQLRTLPADKLVGTSMLTGIMIDGASIRQSPFEVFAEGAQRKVPLVIGANSHEASLPILSDERAAASLGSRLHAEMVASYRRGHDEAEARRRLRGDLFVVAPARALARMHADSGAPAFAYYFDYLPKAARERLPGVPHMGELPFVFGNFDAFDLVGEGPEDRPLSDLMRRYWTRFATGGDPNGAIDPPWRPIGSAEGDVLAISADGIAMHRPNADERAFETIAMTHPRRNAPDL
jgi:para-nitrobenzyl esterase